MRPWNTSLGTSLSQRYQGSAILLDHLSDLLRMLGSFRDGWKMMAKSRSVAFLKFPNMVVSFHFRSTYIRSYAAASRLRCYGANTPKQCNNHPLEYSTSPQPSATDGDTRLFPKHASGHMLLYPPRNTSFIDRLAVVIASSSCSCLHRQQPSRSVWHQLHSHPRRPQIHHPS